ncbi:DNA-binding protein [Photobacterium phosphoreum]|uniref:DNA-binding protein n=1 Tax=Photobacterium phosphoreum TaxID=659 RepID=A0A2T3JBP0_PHOPO|nr:phage antirepressor KilAC domain-containing protein [Photobacterium phosphoreum]PSU19941.1 DNA-binding protein [Photobacterium phosphoreum]PSU38790.1 DNA-binding protein [Photobacterium phosphoreum]PSU46287.1 DNA-binding protein [Photobacterium phosphoreum]
MMDISVSNFMMMMSSREIAELLQSRHDNVKRSMERLSSKGLIQLTPMEEVNHLGQIIEVYHVNKRDSYVVVAQLSPEFTAVLVDRWQESENIQPQQLPQTFAAALQLAADQARQIEIQSKQLILNAPKVDFAERIAKVDYGVTLDEFAHSVHLVPGTIFDVLREMKILISSHQSYNLPMQKHIESGCFVVRQIFNERENSSIECISLLTSKGELWLIKRLIKAGVLKAVAV